MRNAIIILIFAAIAVSFANDVSAYGVGRLGSKFSNQGSLGSKKAAAPATPCSGTGLIFNVACNSQYIGII
jgi:hypothetical protein